MPDLFFNTVRNSNSILFEVCWIIFWENTKISLRYIRTLDLTLDFIVVLVIKNISLNIFILFIRLTTIHLISTQDAHVGIQNTECGFLTVYEEVSKK